MTKAITKNSKKGFTLVELVIVIAILAILAAIAIPVVNSIINTASRNGALSNAETIELAIKECQADIAAKNGEVYPQAANGQHSSITVQTVATAKAIPEAFEQVTVNGTDYLPFWDKDSDKCVFLDGSNNEIETEAAYANAANCEPLATVASGSSTVTISSTAIDNL